MTQFVYRNNLDAEIWLQTSAEVNALCHQAFNLAYARVQVESARSTSERVCVVSDLDETMLDNSAFNEYLAVSGDLFKETENWNAYCAEGVSLANPGAVVFAQRIRKLKEQRGGLQLIFVTSRRENLRAVTVANLVKVGILLENETEPYLSTAPESSLLFMSKMASFNNKYEQYDYLRNQRGFEILVTLGDNGSDFALELGKGSGDIPSHEQRVGYVEQQREAFGEKWIVFPNPVYGQYLTSLRTNAGQVFDNGATDEKKEPLTLESTPKIQFLKPWVPRT